ncbi:hypothetical protein ACOMHN_001981 [Nucella lapillus]
MDQQHTDDQWSSTARFSATADVNTSTSFSVSDDSLPNDTGSMLAEDIPSNTKSNLVTEASPSDKTTTLFTLSNNTPASPVSSYSTTTSFQSRVTAATFASSEAEAAAPIKPSNSTLSFGPGDTTPPLGHNSDPPPPSVSSDSPTLFSPSHFLTTQLASSAPADSYLFQSPPEPGQDFGSLTQSHHHVIEMGVQNVHVLVKQELSEDDRREVERWMESGGSGAESEGELDTGELTVCAPQSEVEGWRDGGEGVQGVVKREEEEEEGEEGTTTMTTMTEVTTVSSSLSSSSSSVSRWSHADTMKLIQLYKENRHYFDDKQIKKKTVWAMLAGKLARGSKSKGKFTCTQVYNRWKNLTKTYRDCVQDIQRVGTWVGKCRFFEEMASVYNDDGSSQESNPPTTTPTTTMHRVVRKRRRCGPSQPTMSPSQGSFRTIAPKVVPSSQDEPKPGNTSADASSRVGVEGGGGVLMRGGGGGGFGDVVRAMRELQEEEKARDEWKMARLERMHREKMDMFAQFLGVLKERVT